MLKSVAIKQQISELIDQRLVLLQELERLNQVLEEEKMKFEEVVMELKAEQEHIRQ